MATNYANATYTEVIDLQTTADKISIIGIHTPVGKKAYARMKGFFTQFRKYRYNGIKSLVMVPAAQLPVDPLGLTGQVGSTQLMDPREMLNPILFHGCHGESLTRILDTIYSSQRIVDGGANALVTGTGGNVADSADQFNLDIATDLSQYYTKLTDPTWRKFGIQSGVKLRKLRPLVHRVAQNMPTLPSAFSTDPYSENEGLFEPVGVSDGTSLSPNTGTTPSNATADSRAVVPIGENERVYPIDSDGDLNTLGNSVRVYKQQFTNRMTTLGWLPTALVDDGKSQATAAKICTLPRLFMGVLVMPPAYNIEQFFRMVITHSFSFKEFTSTLSLMDPTVPVGSNTVTEGTPYSNWIDYGSTLDTISGKSEVVSDGVS